VADIYVPELITAPRSWCAGTYARLSVIVENSSETKYDCHPKVVKLRMLREDVEDPKAFVRFPTRMVVLQKGSSVIEVRVIQSVCLAYSFDYGCTGGLRLC
jgi:hypothetical protein